MSTNAFVRDMDLAEFNVLDGRRWEIVADGLTLWHGAQLAVDTTMGHQSTATAPRGQGLQSATGGADSSPPTQGTDLPRARGRRRESASRGARR